MTSKHLRPVHVLMEIKSRLKSSYCKAARQKAWLHRALLPNSFLPYKWPEWVFQLFVVSCDMLQAWFCLQYLRLVIPLTLLMPAIY